MSTSVYDWTTVTSPSEALDWFNNSIRKAAEYNVFGNKTVFEAIVLSDAYPLSVLESGAPGFPTPADGETGPTWGLNTRFAFPARIVGMPTPHAFLPNPCDPQYEAESSLVNTWLIDAHTTFISQIGYSTDPKKRPKIGDIVEVRLRPGPNGYDLQFGNFIKILDSYRVGATRSDPKACVSMKTLFQISPNTTALLRTEATPDFDPIIPQNMIPHAQYPTSGRLSSPFSYLRIDPVHPENGGRPHPGLDISAPTGTPVYAALPGKVISIMSGCVAPQSSDSSDRVAELRRCGSGYGNYIRIEHGGSPFLHLQAGLPLWEGDKVYTSYNHLRSVDVSVGDTVNTNQKIGEVGHTGHSTGPHLHWEVSTDPNFRRPTLQIVNPKVRRGDPDRMGQVDPRQGLGLATSRSVTPRHASTPSEPSEPSE